MTEEPSAPPRRAMAGIAATLVVAVLALGGRLALVTLWPRLGSSFDGQVPGHGQEHLVVQRLRGVLGERWELQMRVGYDGEGPRWAVSLPAEPDQVVLADDLAVLRASSDRGPRREAYSYADGALLWTQDACVGPTTPCF